MNKVATVNLKGNEYALVPVRLKAFREENPYADIQTEPHWNPDGSLDFETRIVKNQKDESSAKGTGWAHYSAQELKAPKSYEKLSTISLGRALSNMGYLNNGQVASTEELEEFYETKLVGYTEKIDNATTVNELVALFEQMNTATKQMMTERLGEKKRELQSVKTNN